MFDLQRIYGTGVLAGEIDYHPRLPSTNTRALELGQSESLALPLLVLAEEQTAGRGRGANRWWMGDGGLAFSLMIDAHSMRIPTALWPQLSLVSGLAVCEALEGLVAEGDFSLKWPNDVYASEKKLCGLLIEGVPGQQQRLVVGIGINVSTDFSDAPPDVRSRATSLHEEVRTSERVDKTTVLAAVLESLMRRFEDLARTGFDGLRTAWQKRSLLTGREVVIQVGNTQVQGHCLGLAEGGGLRVLTANGPTDLVAGSIVEFGPRS